MTDIAKIDDEVITADDFIKFLKLNDKFKPLLEEVMANKLTVHAAKKQGLSVNEEETQERVDQFRRIYGLHRAKDMLEHLEELGVSVDEFGSYIEESIFHEKMTAKVQNQEAVDEFFNLNSPKFESVELRHILLNSEDITYEVMAILEDDPDSFDELAKEHSMASDTAEKGGALGKIYRGKLVPELEAKIFNAKPGDIVGPFGDEDSLLFEIFQVTKIHQAICDPDTEKQIKKQLYESWLESSASEHKIEVLLP